MAAVGAFVTSLIVTAGLLLRGRLILPHDHVGREVTFPDGTTSRIYRETLRLGTSTRQPTLLVVRFRLRFVGRNRFAHALFRAESLANTPLFAGFRGFRSKLWLTDEQTDVYRGIYEWDGTAAARHYATTLVKLLRPFCVPGSVLFEVESGRTREDFLSDPRLEGGVAA